jgi:hypothetical protein
MRLMSLEDIKKYVLSKIVEITNGIKIITVQQLIVIIKMSVLIALISTLKMVVHILDFNYEKNS